MLRQWQTSPKLALKLWVCMGGLQGGQDRWMARTAPAGLRAKNRNALQQRVAKHPTDRVGWRKKREGERHESEVASCKSMGVSHKVSGHRMS